MSSTPPPKSDPIANDKRFQTPKCHRRPPPGKTKYEPNLMSVEIIPVHKRHCFDNPVPIWSPAICDGCSMAPVGGTSMYGAFTRSGFACNSCCGCDVCNRPCYGCNNYACSGSTW